MTARDAYLRRKYNITEADYDAVWVLQAKQCGMCGRKRKKGQKRFAVDHDHKSSDLRSIVCHYCNKYRIGRHDLTSALDLVEYMKHRTFLIYMGLEANGPRNP